MEDYNSALQSLYRNEKSFAAFADWAAERRKGQSGTTAGALCRRLGNNISVREAAQLLEQLGQYELGTYRRGRPLENSRISWNRGCSIMDIAKAMRGEKHIEFEMILPAPEQKQVRRAANNEQAHGEIDETNVWETGISLDDAKQLIATFYDISEDAIEITIRV